jgi:trans-2,3-dihydro-3-hydroxyanthranilate isomerase
MGSLPYEIVDVFTDRPFAGNPLAVVFGGEDLSRDQMQILAREFNLSETVFVLPPTMEGASYRARFFTPAEELPFAGHPSIGAAVTQCRRGLLRAGVVQQECAAGVLPLDLEPDGRAATLTGGTPTLGIEVDPAAMLASVGLTDEDLNGAASVAGCGLDYTYVPVFDDAITRARLTFTGAPVDPFCLVSWNRMRRTAHCRVFLPGAGVPEDPATGSAALGLGVWLVASGVLPLDAESSYVVRQGAEMHRPSTLECSVSVVDGVAVRVTVRGAVVPIAKGEIAVPPFIG